MKKQNVLNFVKTLAITKLMILAMVLLSPTASFSQKTPTAAKTPAVSKAASTTNTADTAKYAILYVYRPKSLQAMLMSYSIHLDDSIICQVKNNSVQVIKLYKEGPAELWAKTEAKKKVKINVKFGQEYFLKCTIHIGVVVPRPEVNLVQLEQGREEYNEIEERKNKKAKN
jgi:hypothetical protein